jgi:vitamin B12 transporter
MKRFNRWIFLFLLCAAPLLKAQEATPSPQVDPTQDKRLDFLSAKTPEESSTPVATVVPTAVSKTSDDFLLDEVVVSSDRLPTPKDQVAGSITVLTAKDLEREQQTTVAGALREIPGVDVIQEGGDGRNTTVSLRGSGSNRTLVFVDGVEVNDPIGNGGSGGFDFSSLTADNVERIEVLRGSQSALYGPDATGGVIQIFTKKSQGPLQGSLTNEIGSLGYLRSALGVNGGDRWLDYSVQVSHVRDTGFSAAASAPNQTTPLENDGTQNTVVSSRFESNPVSFMTLRLVQRYTEAKTDVDAGAFEDEPDHINQTRDSLLEGEVETRLLDNHWQQTFSFSQALQHFYDLDGSDLYYPHQTFYNGRREQFDWQNNLRLIPHHIFSFGFDSRQEWGDTTYTPKATDHDFGWYFQDQASYGDRFFFSSGVRWDHHDVYDGRADWRLAPAYIVPFTQTKLKTTLGTGWQTPTLYERFDPTYGTASLLPERSLSWDFGFEQPFLRNRIRLNAVLFDNQYKNFLNFDNSANDYWGAFVNTPRVRSRGSETSLEGRFYKDSLVNLSINYTETENSDTLQLLPGHPSHRASLGVDSPTLYGARIGFEILYTGRRNDLLWPDVLAPMADYTLARLHADWKITKRVSVFGRVENLFNRRYQEVYGYQTSPRAFYAGSTFQL